MADPTRVNGEKYRNAPARVVTRALERREITPGGCWVWTGPTLKGYGQTVYKVRGRQFSVYIHRLVYTHLVGDPGDMTQLDHACHDPETCMVPPLECPHRRCFNPDHLEPVTNEENSLRGRTLIAVNVAKTHCGTCGEPYDEANTYRLTRIWREQLVELALPDWCRHHFETFLPEPRDFPDPALARRVANGDQINEGRRAARIAGKLANPRSCETCGADISLYHGRARFCVVCTPTRRLRSNPAQHAAMDCG